MGLITKSYTQRGSVDTNSGQKEAKMNCLKKFTLDIVVVIVVVDCFSHADIVYKYTETLLGCPVYWHPYGSITFFLPNSAILLSQHFSLRIQFYDSVDLVSFVR